MRRTNQLVLAGIAFFIVGVVIVLVVARNNGKSSGSSGASTDLVPVLVAKEDLASGTKGDDAIGKVEVRQVRPNERLADALTSTSELSSTRIVASFTKGEQLRSSGITAAIPSVTPPAGKEAVPVKVSFVAGGAGYISRGDFVNIYQVIPAAVTGGSGGGQPPYPSPRTELLLTKVQVLDVSIQIASLASQSTTVAAQQPQQQSRPGTADQVVVVLALATADTEKVIFGSSTESLQLYLTKVDKDAVPAGPTNGQDYQTILQQEANDALAAAGN